MIPGQLLISVMYPIPELTLCSLSLSCPSESSSPTFEARRARVQRSWLRVHQGRMRGMETRRDLSRSAFISLEGIYGVVARLVRAVSSPSLYYRYTILLCSLSRS